MSSSRSANARSTSRSTNRSTSKQREKVKEGRKLVKQYIPKQRPRARSSDSFQKQVDEWNDREGKFTPLVSNVVQWAEGQKQAAEKSGGLIFDESKKIWARHAKATGDFSLPTDLEIADALLTLELAEVPLEGKVARPLMALYHFDDSAHRKVAEPHRFDPNKVFKTKAKGERRKRANTR